MVDWVPALVVLVVVLVVWQESIEIFHIKKFLAPQPTAIASTFWADRHELLSAGWFTFQEALGGFVIGCGFALLCALVLARWRGLGRALMPYMIAASAVPIIAFAPIMNAWFNPFSKGSKMAIAAVLCFFPVLVNSLRGLTSVRPESVELMRSYGAGELETFRRVRIPTALPFIFTSLKIATVLAMIGAIVGEYFGGPIEALGVKILNDSSYGNFTDAARPSSSRRRGRESASPAPSESPSISRSRWSSGWPCAGWHRQATDRGSEWRRGFQHERGPNEAQVLGLRDTCCGCGDRGSGRRRRHESGGLDEIAEADQGDAPAEVGYSGAVRGLLRREGQGVLQGSGTRRQDQAWRP
jgi:NitT/TauT family transport system permease protein